ncbi:MAG: helix-turn-helix transcriptional regulator [Acidimicrobiales bacterium]|nr:helix-turn-helix transcriptional regulator [Acidimicrobiales bacterium]MCB9393425.1 helix-turn-helix transcriptional regulator [Acidimicrobiaceae bacterium]
MPDPVRHRPTVVDEIVDLARRASRRPVLVRSPPGGGASWVVRTAADTLNAAEIHAIVVPSLSALDADAQLELRARRRTHVLLLGTEDDVPPRLAALVDYLRPQVVDVPALGLDEVRLFLDAAVDGEPCTDELASNVLVATEGRLGDVVDVAAHLVSARRPGGTDAARSLRLCGFAPTAARLAEAPGAADGTTARWAVATAERVATLAVGYRPAGGLRAVDAVAIRDSMDPATRRDVLQALCEEARAVEAGALTPDEQVTVAAWWCELAASSEVDVPLTGPELQALLAGVLVAADVGRWDAVGRLATRLWRTTRVPQAAVGVAAALARSAPTPLLDELLAAHPDDELVRVTATFSRALWLLYVDHRPDAARQLLETVLETVSTHRELCEDGLATVDLHTGDPDAVERRVGDRPPTPGAPTSFALHALALADLARGRHARVLGRLDDELERSLHPGMNLTADRYRFVRSLVSSRSGGAEPDERTELSEELRRLYEGALRRGDDWNIGWTGWVAGQFDARRGHSVSASRRLRTAVDAFRRAHRPGFADWPLAAAVATAALHEGAAVDAVDVDVLADPRHAVRAERADALLSLAMQARSAGAGQAEVAARLREALDVACVQREVLTGHLVAIEQLLLGVTPGAPPDDDAADGPVLDACRTALAGSADDLERAGTELVRLDWSVLGVRILARAAERLRIDDPLRSTRLFQTIRTVVDGFDQPLRPWVVVTPTLPTLSARELQVARGVAAGASRDELAATLVVSRRTIDSHLQRVYAKLGISGRAELRDWLDDTGVRAGSD